MISALDFHKNSPHLFLFFSFASLFNLTLDSFASTKPHPRISSPELGETQEQKKNECFFFVAILLYLPGIITSFCHFLSSLQILLIQDEDFLT